VADDSRDSLSDTPHSSPAGSTPPSSSGPGPGTGVGRYVILERVGEGGMGVVFSAYDPELDRRVALKLLAPDLIEEDARLRLLREAQAMARLSHPNVVPVYDAGTVDGRVFVAMEFVQGVTLRTWLAGETHDWTEVLDTLRRAALGLHAAHEAGLVHRDFKPDNVMVGDDGRVRVLDFGLARSASIDSVPAGQAETPDTSNNHKALSISVTSEGAMLGTPAYMPPEQLEGGNVDARSDQWSFCVTLYEALYGTRPFAGDTIAAFVLAMHNNGVQPPPDASPVPRSVFAAIHRGLELEPDARHPSLRALLDALELPPPARRSLRPIGALGALGLGAVAAGTWWWSAQHADDPCKPRTRAAAEVWSDDMQQAGADAFERSTVPYRAEAWERASARVSTYVESWGTEAERACRAAAPGTAEVDALRNRCLDRRLRRLTSVVETFATANDDVVRGAITTAFQLPDLQPCADVPGLLGAVRPPSAPDQRAELERLEVALEAAIAQTLSGNDTQGSRQAQVVVDHARQLGYDPFTAEALRTQASFAAERGDYETARKLGVEAFELAAAARDDEGAAQTASDLLFILGSKLRVPAAADAWTTVGAAMLERAGPGRQATGAAFHNAVGNVAMTRGNHARALLEFSAARDLWDALPGDHPIEIASALGNLGVVAFRMGDMAAARDYQERALAIEREVFPPGHPRLEATASNLGLVLASAGEPEAEIDRSEETVADSP